MSDINNSQEVISLKDLAQLLDFKLHKLSRVLQRLKRLIIFIQRVVDDVKK